MNPSTVSFPCSVGDKVTDNLTGLTGKVSSLASYSDASQGICITYLKDGEMKNEWVANTRVEAAS